ncbi:MAG: hypothetical protein GXO74_01155 [Calditrichaeota bacterium]|nr:hypothetical protein [Calditrichota bacterium]
MSGSGVIIRLIDIVLLLLFGFIAISEIEKKSPVKLPQSVARVKNKQEEDELLILGITLNENKKLTFIVEAEDATLPSLRSVKDKILRRRKTLAEEFDRKLKVRIRSDWNLPIKYTMKIAKFCQKNNIPVGMDVETKSRKF